MDEIEAFVISSVADGLKFLFEKIRMLKCAKEFNVLESFQIAVNENFRCCCGRIADMDCNLLMVKVEISEIKDLGVGFLEVFKRSRANRVLRFCSDNKCLIKKSETFGVLSKTPLYWIVEVEFKLDYYELMTQNFNFEVQSEDFFIHDKPVHYEIYLICASNFDRTFIFVNVKGNWFDVESGFHCDSNNMIFNLNSFQCRIDLIVYKQKTSLNLKLPKNKFETQTLGQNYCVRCKTIKIDDSPCKKCSVQEKKSWTCLICNKSNDDSSGSCKNCEKIQSRKPNLLQSACPKCSSPITNGQKCKNCFNLHKNPETLRPISASSSVSKVNIPNPSKILCKKCQSPLENQSDICGMCQVPEETKASIPHKVIPSNNNLHPAKSPIIPPKNEPSSPVLSNLAQKTGKNLMDKILPPTKRPISISRTPHLCSNCRSKLNANEKRNCGPCKKTHSGPQGKCPYCDKFDPICDSCLKKKKNTNNK